MLCIAVLCQRIFSKSPMAFITSAHKNYTAEILVEQSKGRKDAVIDKVLVFVQGKTETGGPVMVRV